MEKWLFTPPLAFLFILTLMWLASKFFARLSFCPGRHAKGTGEPYACGEENYDPMAQPDYSNFFPFAFFFTLAHVATLILTTVPVETLETFVIAAIYIISATVGLYILFRR